MQSYCHIKDILDLDYLQRGIDTFAKWTERWQVTLIIRKCKVMTVHHRHVQMAELSQIMLKQYKVRGSRRD